MLGKKVTVVQGDITIHGIATDLNDDGSLILKTADQEIPITSGDIQVRY